METLYTIANDPEDFLTEDTFYLNHSCLSTKSFGSDDMMWVADSLEEAQKMLLSIPDDQEAYIIVLN